MMASALTHKVVRADKVEPKSTKKRGNGLFARQDIKAGEAILSVHYPLMLALDTPRLKDTCYGCYKQPSGCKKDVFRTAARLEDDYIALKLCTRCKTVRYCTKRCQKASWVVHKYECKLFTDLSPKILPNNVRAIVRLLKQYDAGQITNEEWEQLRNLEHHIEDVKKLGGERWETLLLIAKGAKEYSGTNLDEGLVLQICAQLLVNTFTWVTDTFDPLGLALHPIAALMNHSCQYNSILRFDSIGDETPRNTCMTVIAMSDIDAGQEILISYVDTTMPYDRRQSQLQEKYFFHCRCPRCKMGTDFKYDNFLANNISPLSPSGIEDKSLADIEARAIQLYDSAIKEGGISGPINKLKYGLHLMSKTDVWPLSRFPNPMLRQELITAYIRAEQYNLAYVHALIQWEMVDPILFSKPYHPTRMVHAYVLTRLAYLLTGRQQVNSKYHEQQLDICTDGIARGALAQAVLTRLLNALTKVEEGSFASRVRMEFVGLLYHDWQGSAPAVIQDPEKKGEWWVSLRKMMDDVLKSEKVWPMAG